MTKLFPTLRVRSSKVLTWLRIHRAELAETKDDSAGAVLKLAELPTLAELEQELQDFPEQFRTAFLLAPLAEDSPLMAGHSKERESLESRVEDWRKGAKALVAIVGGNGSGKSSLLNWLQGHCLSPEEVIRLDMDSRIRSGTAMREFLAYSLMEGEVPPETDSLVQRLKQEPQRAILVDDAHAFALRAMGIAEALRALLVITLATREHHLWIMTFAQQAWRRLDHQFGLSRYFTDVVQLSDFSVDELGIALRTRLQESGLSLAKGESENPGDEAEDDSEQEAAIDRYVRELFAFSAGNMVAALYYWLLRVRYVDGALEVQGPKTLDLSALKTLEQSQQFTLAEILANGGLTVEEHAEIFQCDPARSYLVLQQLYGQRLLITKTNASGQALYRVNPVLDNAISLALVNAKILY